MCLIFVELIVNFSCFTWNFSLFSFKFSPLEETRYVTFFNCFMFFKTSSDEIKQREMYVLLFVKTASALSLRTSTFSKFNIFFSLWSSKALLSLISWITCLGWLKQWEFLEFLRLCLSRICFYHYFQYFAVFFQNTTSELWIRPICIARAFYLLNHCLCLFWITNHDSF